MSDIFKKIKSIDPENESSTGNLNLTPIIEDTPPMPEPGKAQDKFPNFIRQESLFNASISHEVHHPSPLILPIAVAAAVIWIICVMAMYFGFFGNIGDAGGRLNVAQWISVLMLAFIPALLIGVIAYALQQLSAMSAAATQLTRAAKTLGTPDDAVVGKAKVMSHAVSKELDTIKHSFDHTVGRISTLEEIMRAEREKLDASSEAVKNRFESISATLIDQHTALQGIADIFDERMASLSGILTGHQLSLESSSQLAEQKLQEARVSLDNAIDKMDVISDSVRENALSASNSLTVGHEEIETLSLNLQSRSDQLSETYKSHSQELAGIMAVLKDEQDNLATSLDARLQKMRDMSLSAQVGAESLREASESGRETVEALANAASLTDSAVKKRFAEMEDMVRYSNARAESISDTATRRVQDSLSQTRKEISRIEADMAALQNRLETHELAPRDLNLETPEPPARRERKPISLKPLDDDFPPVQPRVPVTTEPELALTGPSPIQQEQAATITEEPLETSVEEFPHDITTALDSFEPESAAVSDFDLEIQPPDEPLDLTPPDPDEALKTFSPETIKRAVPIPQLRGRKTKPKSRWGWRDMIGGLQADEEEVLEAAEAAPAQDYNIADDEVVSALTYLGLAPGAIVDDGCIVEACNARKANGALAMSQIVAKRLGDPVRHLYIKMEENPILKSNARAFTAQYKIGIEAIEDDREAIRIRLESDTGRAFLLCDAALNG